MCASPYNIADYSAIDPQYGARMKHPDWLVHTNDGKIARGFWEEARTTFPHGARLLRFSDNHDWRRAVVHFGEESAYAASILNFTLDGIPFLYNRQEIVDTSPTHWIRSAPIAWVQSRDQNDREEADERLKKNKRLFAIRNENPALYFQLYSGRVSTELGAYGAMVGKRIPLAPL